MLRVAGSGAGRRSGVLALGIAAGLASASLPARALETGEFSWSRAAGAESCPSEAELRASVIEALGRDPFATSDGPAVHARVEREGDVLIARLALRAPGDRGAQLREFRAGPDDCAALARAVALAVALAVENFEARAVPSPPPPPKLARDAPATAPPSSPELDVRPASAPRAAQDAGARWSLVGQARWSLGVLPRPTTGLGIALRRALGAGFSATAGGDWLPAASDRGRFSVELVTARVGGCFDWFEGASFTASSCAQGLAGALRVRNEAGRVSDPGTAPWFAAALSAQAATRLGSVWLLEAGLEGALPFERPIHRADGCPPVGFQHPIATASIFAGLGASFF